MYLARRVLLSSAISALSVLDRSRSSATASFSSRWRSSIPRISALASSRALPLASSSAVASSSSALSRLYDRFRPSTHEESCLTLFSAASSLFSTLPLHLDSMAPWASSTTFRMLLSRPEITSKVLTFQVIRSCSWLFVVDLNCSFSSLVTLSFSRMSSSSSTAALC